MVKTRAIHRVFGGILHGVVKEFSAIPGGNVDNQAAFLSDHQRRGKITDGKMYTVNLIIPFASVFSYHYNVFRYLLIYWRFEVVI